MLCFGQRKYPFLPFVISLFTYAIFFTPAFHSQSTVPAFRDSPGPHGQLGLLIQLLQFCAHNKKHPRIADSTRESRILSATIREYCVTLSFCTQAAATFDGYVSRMGQGLGQAWNPEVGAESFWAENKEKVLKSCDFRTFMVAETGLEPATSGL